MGRRDLKKKTKNLVGCFHHGDISSLGPLQHHRHLRPRVIVSRSLSRSITQPPNLPSADGWDGCRLIPAAYLCLWITVLCLGTAGARRGEKKVTDQRVKGFVKKNLDENNAFCVARNKKETFRIGEPLTGETRGRARF